MGVWVLTTGLTVGASGGAIAIADTGDGTDSSSSSAGPSGSPAGTGSSGTGTAGKDENPLQKAVTDTIRGITGVLSPQRTPAKATGSSGIDKADDLGEAAGEQTETSDQLATGTESTLTPTVAGADVVTAGSTNSAPAPLSTPVAGTAPHASSGPATSQLASAPAATPAGPAATPPVPNLLKPASVVITSVPNIALTIGGEVMSVPALIVSLPGSATPVTDVIGFLQAAVTSTTDSVLPLLSVPGGIANILTSISAPTPVTGAMALGSGAPSPVNVAAAPVLPQPPTAPAPSVIPLRVDVSAPDALTFATLGGFAAPVTFAPPAAPPAPAPSVESHVGAIVTGTLAALLISASLWALFATALPGLGGLAAISATGMRIGYRQAKAGTALHRTELARFAVRGPIGVVRTGSLVSLHSRPQRRPRTPASQLRLLDRAA